MTIGVQSAFSACISLKSVEIPSSVTSIGVVRLAPLPLHALLCLRLAPPEAMGVRWVQQVFYDCTSLTSVDIPSSVTSIGDVRLALLPPARVALPPWHWHRLSLRVCAMGAELVCGLHQPY